MAWLRIPVYATLGLSFTACDERRLPDPDAEPDPMAAPEGQADDPIVGLWRASRVEQDHGVTYTSEYALAVADDLTATFSFHGVYDAPGTAYDEDYHDVHDLTVAPLGSAKYRLVILNPETSDTPMTCTLSGSSLDCDPEHPAIPDLKLQRVE